MTLRSRTTFLLLVTLVVAACADLGTAPSERVAPMTVEEIMASSLLADSAYMWTGCDSKVVTVTGAEE